MHLQFSILFGVFVCLFSTAFGKVQTGTFSFCVCVNFVPRFDHIGWGFG